MHKALQTVPAAALVMPLLSSLPGKPFSLARRSAPGWDQRRLPSGLSGAQHSEKSYHPAVVRKPSMQKLLLATWLVPGFWTTCASQQRKGMQSLTWRGYKGKAWQAVAAAAAGSSRGSSGGGREQQPRHQAQQAPCSP